MFREQFPARLKMLREKSGFTQREVAKETGISASSIAKYETGKLEPDIEKLAILIEFYGAPADWVLGTGSRKNDNNCLLSTQLTNITHCETTGNKKAL